MKELNIPLLFELKELQSSKIDDKALLTQLLVIKIAIERRQPTQRTISKSRILIHDDEFVSHREEGNDKKYAGKKFGLIMKLKETNNKNCQRINPLKELYIFQIIIPFKCSTNNFLYRTRNELSFYQFAS